MNKHQAATLVLTLLILGAPSAAYATISVGIKKGDWITYQVTITGNVPSDHNATWAKMEITQIHGNTINLNITTAFANAIPLQEQITLNLEAGLLGDDFIIPANLDTGDTFFDNHQGNITITGTKQVTVASAERTIICASTTETNYFWDQATGVLVEAHTTHSDYNMTTQADKTNMWQPQPQGVDTTVLYTTVISMVAIGTSVGLLLRHRKKHGASV